MLACAHEVAERLYVPSLHADIVVIILAIFALLGGRHCGGGERIGSSTRVGGIDALLVVCRLAGGAGCTLFGRGWDVNEQTRAYLGLANADSVGAPHRAAHPYQYYHTAHAYPSQMPCSTTHTMSCHCTCPSHSPPNLPAVAPRPPLTG
jgi:hypothetical protein